MNPFKQIAKVFGSGENIERVAPSSPIYDIELKSIQGKAIDLAQFKGKFILIVNVASKCGFTPQYEELESLYQKYKDKLMIIGTPCNQFGNQEPGSAEDIQSFCSVNYGVSFLISEKLDVKGKNQHPLYKWLTNKNINGHNDSSVRWNFYKFLIDPKGRIVEMFNSLTKPGSNKVERYLK